MGLMVVVGGQKGGCGKSTIATGLAVEAARDGKKTVLLADMDTRQQTSVDWAARRRESGFKPPLNTQLVYGPAALSPLRAVQDFIVVDLPPWADVETVAVARLSNLFLVVTAPNNVELNPTVMLMRELDRVGLVERTAIALSKVIDARDEELAREYLAAEGYSALPVPLRFFASSARVGNDGRVVTEAHSKIVADQARMFFGGVFRVLERVQARSLSVPERARERGRER
jgi:chromosome partitioning protein